MHWTLQNIVWIFGFALEISLVGVLFYRRIWRTYPLFCSYALMEALRSAALLTIGNGPRHYATYFYVFWISEGIVSFFGFAVIAEIFRSAFSEKLGLDKWGTIFFRCALLGLVVAALLTARAIPMGDVNKLLATIFLLKRIESFVRLGLVAALFMFVFALGLPWTKPVIGIAAGFAIHGAVEVVATGMRARYGYAANKAHGWTLMIVGICQQILWLIYFLPRHSPPPTPPASSLLDSAAELAKMDAATNVLVER